MRRLYSLIILVAGIAAGAGGSYWYAHRSETIATPAAAGQSESASTERKILYYRNPMGLPDTSPVPKKDSMGMDYIAVYADEQDDAEHGQGQPRQDPAHRRADREGRRCRSSRTVRGDRHRGARRVAASDRHRALRRLHRGPVRQQDRPARPRGRAAVPLLQPANPARAGRSPGGDAGGRHAAKSEASGSVAGAMQTSAQSRRSREPHRRGAQEPDQPAHHRLGLARDRRRHREEGHQGPARHGRRRAVPHRRPLARLGDRRCRRGRYRRDQGGHARHGDAPRLPRRAARRRGDLHLSGDDEAGDAHGRRAHRAAESGREAEARHVCRCGVSGRRRRCAGDRRARQRHHRQRHAPGRAGGQGRRPLRAARRQARPPRRRLHRDREGLRVARRSSPRPPS